MLQLLELLLILWIVSLALHQLLWHHLSDRVIRLLLLGTEGGFLAKFLACGVADTTDLTIGGRCLLREVVVVVLDQTFVRLLICRVYPVLHH